MKAPLAVGKKLAGAHWEMLGLTAVLFVLVVVFVDLKPVVEENFFFSTSDPGFGQSKKIEHRFPSQPQLILAISSRDISSPRYLQRIQKLTQEVEGSPVVTAVKSLTLGPNNSRAGIEGPSWSRLLIGKDRKSNNIIVFPRGGAPSKLVTRLEKIVHESDAEDFRIHMAGTPYVVEMLKRSIT